MKRKIQNDTVPVPCGKCPDCLARRVSAWSFRLMQEDKIATSSLFLTLTYANEHLRRTRNGFKTVQKRDLQLFMKRLRYNNPGKKLKYYAAAEYGTETMRPHYHVILFNASLDTIQDSWMYGSVHYGDVTGASVGYTLKYISKPRKIPIHRNDDREPEFALMSKGLGANYLTPTMRAWHLKDLDNRMYCNLEDGKKISMPRYYKDKVYNEQQRKRVAFMSLKKVKEREAERIRMGKVMDDVTLVEVHHQAFKKMHAASSKRNKL